ncbi:MAG: MCE family protein [Lentisphaerae bacterium]|jgi:paraquat-inducible protein B|nr:MCE family protein [Lentisphaerota bacterium]MBT4822031.1 MCE family protein [Lentisphaerota bacterium]MBT5609899.1 MCE family protein [Lentisphaerota bacterium]MBT7061422.1 MCE family protein [Lentisphaerota bacterium]MBT7847500.1 MCE family protein [Lentisphaerota bacterium]
MASEAHKLKLGLFVVLALAALVTIVLALGSGRFGAESVNLATMVDDSVQGLEVGSPVKLRGVKVGRVTDISLDGGSDVPRRLIVVQMALEPKLLGSIPEAPAANGQTQYDAFFAGAVAQGLRASLILSGITGLKYVELDYFLTPEQVALEDTLRQAPPDENRKHQARAAALRQREAFAERFAQLRVIYIPCESSSFKKLEETVTDTIDRIAEVKFVEIAQNLLTLSTRVNDLLADERVEIALNDFFDTVKTIKRMSTMVETTMEKSFVKDVAEITSNIRELSGKLNDLVDTANRFLANEDLKSAVRTVTEALPHITKIITQVEKEVGKLNLGNASEDLSKTFSDVRGAANTVSGMGGNIKRSLDELERAARAMRRLTEFIEEHPSALIRGRPLPAQQP